MWEGPEDPILYLRSLVAKSLALGSWEEKGHAGKLLHGEVLDLSELFRPDTFLNALRQQSARQGRVRFAGGGVVSVCHGYIMYNDIDSV